MKRNAFGQLMPASLHIRSFFSDDGAGAGGGDGGEGKGGDGDNAGSEFKPPASQEEFDRIVRERVARAERNAREDERKKLTAEQQKPEDKGGKKDDDGKPSGVTETDVDKRIADALAAKDKELAIERVSDRLDKALEGRVVSASKLFSLDRAQFVKDDGKTVDDAALAAWVKDNSAEAPKADRRLRGQGERDVSASGGSVQSGRDLFISEKKPTRKD
ncbi:hypothetical protein [Microbacterium rhizophilus]|uniref:hypothetical protein n=1 Tax=Microbacterium rhizophilus TaxID=3138934 RepID=UPI0031EA5CDC